MAIKHAFVSVKADSANAGLSSASEWNADHVDSLSVMAQGATGDGVTDDTIAIQAALDAGGIVNFPTGRYLVTDTLSIPSSTTLQGQGRGSVIVVTSAFSASAKSVLTNADHTDGNTDIALRDLSISVSDDAHLDWGAAYPKGVICFARVTRLRVSRVSTPDFESRNMFWLFGCKDFAFTECDLENVKEPALTQEWESSFAGGAIWVYGGYDASHDETEWDTYNGRIIGCSVSTKTDEALAIIAGYANAYDMTVTGNHFANSNADSIAVSIEGVDNTFGDGVASDVILANNVVSGSVIVRSSAENITLANNQIRAIADCSAAPITVVLDADGGAAPTAINVTGNNITADDYGIIFDGVSASSAMNNTIVGASAVGIDERVTTGDTTHRSIVISNNSLVSCATGIKFTSHGVSVHDNHTMLGATGILAWGACNDSEVRSNRCTSYTDTGIDVNANSLTVVNLDVRHNTTVGDGSSPYGIRLQAGTFSTCLLQENRSRGNATAQIISVTNGVYKQANFVADIGGTTYNPWTSDNGYAIGGRAHAFGSVIPTYTAIAGTVVWSTVTGQSYWYSDGSTDDGNGSSWTAVG